MTAQSKKQAGKSKEARPRGKTPPAKSRAIQPQKKETGQKSRQAEPKTRQPAEKGPAAPEAPHHLEPSAGLTTYIDTFLRLVNRFQRFAWDAGGVVLMALSLMTLLALPGIPALTGGRLITLVAGQLRLGFGYASVFIPILGMVMGFSMLRKKNGEHLKVNWWRLFALELAAFSLMVLSALGSGVSLERAEAGLDGGVIGWGLAELLAVVFDTIGLPTLVATYVVVTPIFLVSILVALGLSRPLLRGLYGFAQPSPVHTSLPGEPTVVMSPIGDGETHSIPAAENKKRGPFLEPKYRKKFRVDEPEEQAAPPPPRDERLPPLNLLVNEHANRPDERNINLTAGLIEKTLAEFGIPAKVIGFKVGPTVTQFAVEPGFIDKNANGEEANKQKVRVAQIAGLSRDLALALSAERLRIEAPVPGRPYIGIEVPNRNSSVVRLRPVLESDTFYKVNSPLAIALGRDVSGQPVVADLAKMPHLLIAGTTGSGKSVCIAALTTCLVMNNTPEDLRLVMIDPKMVELVRFNGLPHLYGKVETNLERILGVLRWTVAEMDRRYRLLESLNARHIDSYNRKIRRRKGGEVLPRIVVMIDELADLMMSAPDQTEPTLVRLAQLARATGIHLVVATQRPSTDVVTGLIKANFPARISFAVASSVDSRVILDTVGAEALLGHGDMLFLPPEAPAPIRSQGAMIIDQEVERVITFWQHSAQSSPVESAPWEKMLAEEEVLADRDDLVHKAIALVKETRKANASLLQRRLHIGYPRAARLMDELEEMGIIGPGTSGRDREVLVDPDDEYESENGESA